MTQKTDFPRIIKRLRLEKGISQKSAAASLNISQALLSHYEKGIRECGLGFIIRCAGFYNVTADYLLGISQSIDSDKETPETKDTEATELIGETKDSIIKKDGVAYDTESILYRNSVMKSVACIFDGLKVKGEDAAQAAYKYFSCCIYLLCADKNQYETLSKRTRVYYDLFKEKNCDIINSDGKFLNILKNLIHNAKNF